MDLSSFGFERRRDVAVILGAGATRGNSVVRPWSLHRPPLDVDFFRRLRSSPLARDNDALRLLSFVEEEFGSLDVRMETFYSQAFLHDQFIGDFTQGRGRRRDYRWSLRYFLRTLPRLFGLSLEGESCVYHEILASAMAATDAFVSFNYDCLLDRALAKSAGKSWDPQKGYSFQIGEGTDDWMDHSGRGRIPNSSIQLLKPHGSFNWERTASGIRLRGNEYESRDDDELLIVPPLWQKSFDLDPYPDVWLRTREVLSSVRALLVIGYSLPETDVYTQATLRMDVSKLEFLCVANPDGDARNRIISALRSAISTTTYVLELDTLAEVAAMLGASRGRVADYPSIV